ncbi:MAG: carboxymuconolactone decarboxylase family protein [Sphingobium sp.]
MSRSTIIERFENELGGWPAHFAPVLSQDPEIMSAFADLHAAGWSHGPLDEKVRHLLLLAVNAACTLRHEGGIRHHAARAVAAGANRAEILEILELTSVLGIHSCSTGLPILAEEVAASDGETHAPPLTDEQQAIKARFLEERGYWSDFLQDMLRFCPALMLAYVGYSTIPYRRGALTPRMREFVFIAIDAQTTHVYSLGIRAHIRQALKLGATPEELAQVLALTAGVGFYTMTTALPLLTDILPDP